jgi:serine/threonine protein kinase
VRGKDVDHRADIFSLGCVLFEMATGTRVFHGESAADTMSAILTKDPLEALPPMVALPAPLERIARHCLEKSADERFQSARDLAFDLGSLSGASATALSAPNYRPLNSLADCCARCWQLLSAQLWLQRRFSVECARPRLLKPNSNG